MLTIHLLTKNNQNTLEKCLQSLLELDSQIIVADLGSTDSTISICKKYNIKIINIKNISNYSEIRNQLVENTTTDWQFYIEPWEQLISGHEEILWATTQYNDAFRIYNVQGDLITKPVRIWKKSKNKFSRPVFEYIDSKNDPILQTVIAGSSPNKFQETAEILNKWKQTDPHTKEVEYYLALNYVSHGMYDEFLTHAKHFLFRSNETTTSTILMNYYYALVQLMYKKNPTECMKHIVYCLCEQPTLAEFWCLLGDAFYKMKQWHRATAFYDNAIIFGSRRLNNDNYPIEISKYKEYPENMLSTCRDIIKSMYSQ